MLDLSSSFNILHLSGEKTTDFLQSQLTNDVRQIQSGQSQWQAYCNRLGLVQSLFLLWGAGQDYYILIAADLLENTLALLKKFAAFSRVQVAVLPISDISLQVERQNEKNLTWEVKSFSENQLHLAWKSNFDCDLLLEQTVSSNQQLRALLISHRFPWLTHATMNLFRPHDINLPELGLISFTKGCFPGQEVIARTQYRGKPKQGLYTFRLDGERDYVPGQVLMQDERQVGQVVDAVFLNDTTYLSAVLMHGFLLL